MGLEPLANLECCYPIHYPHGWGFTSSGKPGATDAARSTVLLLEKTVKHNPIFVFCYNKCCF